MTDTNLCAPLETSLPRRSYVDDVCFADEREAVFLRDWFCVGRAEAIATPGDYLTVDVAGESVVVLRDEEGEVSAFYNLCRHRGSRLVEPRPEPSDSAGAHGRFERNVRCPYHAWTYSLKGGLKAAPYLPEVRGEKESLGLHRIAVLTWGGFVFCRLEPDAGARGGLGAAGGGPSAAGRGGNSGGAPAEAVRRAAAYLENYELEHLRVGRRIVYDVAANWKVVLENYNECYHCGPVHPELCEIVPAFARGGRDLDWESGIPHRDGAVTFSRSGETARAPLPRLDAEERTRHKGELVLPNLMLSCSCDHVAAFTLYPRSATRTTIVCDFLFHPDEMARGGFDPTDVVELWDIVNRQDWRICELVQDGMTSRRFVTGYLAPMEDPSADVRRYVSRRAEAWERAGETESGEVGRPDDSNRHLGGGK